MNNKCLDCRNFMVNSGNCALTGQSHMAGEAGCEKWRSRDERKRGEWVYERGIGGIYYWYCSACKSAFHKSDPRRRFYCYNCGAKMSLAEGYK